MSITWFFSCVIAVTLLHSSVNGHVSVSFPPARLIPYDYITNWMRLANPCGVPKYAGAPRTTFVQGSTINVTWHMSYLHRGGVKVEIMNENGNKNFQTLDVYPRSGFAYTDDSTLQTLQLTLKKNLTCKSCTLRLTKDAAGYGVPYLFYSCSDITIIPHAQTKTSGVVRKSSQINNKCYKGKCLNGGVCNSVTSECKCNHLYGGLRCEEYDECWTDEDCSYHGQCIDTRSVTFPKLLCYCRVGWFGKHCDRVSQVTEIRNDYATNLNYQGAVLAQGRANVYWRYVNNDKEIEIVLKVKSISWIGIGWKPQDTTQDCKHTEQTTIINARIELTKKRSYIKNLLRSNTKPSPHIDPDMESIGVNCPKNRKKRNTPASTNSFASYPGWFQNFFINPGNFSAESRNSLPRWFLEYVEKPDSKHNSQQPAWFQQFLGTPVTENARRTGPYSSNRIEYRGMACSDIVVGSVKGNYYRVNDLYAVGISAPLPDKYYGGKDDITSAIGSQVDGYTTIVFRKRRIAQHYSDQTIADNINMKVIWAYGQESDPYWVRAQCGKPRFYKRDEFKYHGGNRGSKRNVRFTKPRSSPTVAPVPEPKCNTSSGYFRSPAKCNYNSNNFNCRFYLKWMLQNDAITFIVKARQGYDDYWAISIGNNTHTPPFDVYTGWITAQQRVVVTNGWATGYSKPIADAAQNIFGVKGDFSNGITTIQFSRPRVSKSTTDFSFSDTECRFVQFLQGRVVSSQMSNYLFRQDVGKICIKSCQPTTPTSTSTAPTNQSTTQTSPKVITRNTACLKLAKYVEDYKKKKLNFNPNFLYTPQCDNITNLFKPRQCMPLNSICWCVDPVTGNVLQNPTITCKKIIN